MSEIGKETKQQASVAGFLIGFLLLIVPVLTPVFFLLSHGSIYTVPITDLPSYHLKVGIAILGAGFGALSGFFLARGVPRSRQTALVVLPFMYGFIWLFFSPIIANEFDEAYLFSGPSVKETRSIQVTGVTWNCGGRHGCKATASVNPNGLTNFTPSIGITENAYSCILNGQSDGCASMPASGPLCILLNVERVGANARLLVPIGQFRADSFADCRAHVS